MMRLSEPETNYFQTRSGSSTWRRIAIIFAAIIALTAGFIATGQSAHAASAPAAAAVESPAFVAAAQRTAFDAEMIALVNQARKQGGLAPLKENSGLTKLAVTWSNTMMAENKLYHMPNGLVRAQKSGAANLRTWGENVGRGPVKMSAKQLFDAYWNSPSHRDNIMSPRYAYIGMGTVHGASMAYNSMEFTDKVESATKKAAKKASGPTSSSLGKSTKLVVTGGTNIRSGPATSYKSLGKVYKGKKLTGKAIAKSQWYYLGNGKYVLKSKVKKASTKKAAKKVSAPSASSLGYNTQLVVTGGTNIRSGPATSYKSLAKVYKGHKLTGKAIANSNWYYLGNGKYVIKSKVR